jgi:hypothetical protein
LRRGNGRDQRGGSRQGQHLSLHGSPFLLRPSTTIWVLWMDDFTSGLND